MLYGTLDLVLFIESIVSSLTAIVGLPLVIVYGLIVLRSQHLKNKLQIQQLEQQAAENKNRSR